jgi:hypothetical protein
MLIAKGANTPAVRLPDLKLDREEVHAGWFLHTNVLREYQS